MIYGRFYGRFSLPPSTIGVTIQLQRLGSREGSNVSQRPNYFPALEQTNNLHYNQYSASSSDVDV